MIPPPTSAEIGRGIDLEHIFYCSSVIQQPKFGCLTLIIGSAVAGRMTFTNPAALIIEGEVKSVLAPSLSSSLQQHNQILRSSSVLGGRGAKK